MLIDIPRNPHCAEFVDRALRKWIQGIVPEVFEEMARGPEMVQPLSHRWRSRWPRSQEARVGRLMRQAQIAVDAVWWGRAGTPRSASLQHLLRQILVTQGPVYQGPIGVQAAKATDFKSNRGQPRARGPLTAARTGLRPPDSDLDGAGPGTDRQPGHLGPLCFDCYGGET